MASLNNYTPFNLETVEDLKEDFNNLDSEILELEENSDLSNINTIFQKMEDLNNHFNMLVALQTDAAIEGDYNQRINELSGKQGIVAINNNGLPASAQGYILGSLWLIEES